MIEWREQSRDPLVWIRCALTREEAIQVQRERAGLYLYMYTDAEDELALAHFLISNFAKDTETHD